MSLAYLYDGTTGIRHEVAASLDDGRLRLTHEGEPLEDIATADLSLVDRSPRGLTLRKSGGTGWRLKLLQPVPPEIDALFPARQSYGGCIDRVGLWRGAAVCAAASALVIAAGWFAPTLIAPLVPPSVEKAYGDALVGDFGERFCTSPAGDAALRKLTAELDPHPQDLNVRVVDVPVVNAAALPAGNIVIFDKLFEVADTPEELAGVLAHEIAHVRGRHVTAALIREFGIGIFASALGGTTGGRVDGFVALSFTRRAENEADRDALAMLQRAHISPLPTARFFARLKEVEGDDSRFAPAMAYLSSHPLSSARERLFKDAARRTGYRPALTPREWMELRAICSTRPPSS